MSRAELVADSERIIRAAWLYHVTGNTEEQTDDLLGILRAKANGRLCNKSSESMIKSFYAISVHPS
jgi:DNA-binding transcriptional regulator LsrR (DeoR family)